MDIDKIPNREWTEFRMKVPWGHIAGKWWGPRNIQPILALHGWQDNAGTFDPLIPLLPKELAYLAIDLPGHGLSSYLPSGMTYHNMDYVNVVLRTMKEMGWVKISILGHSMGGVVGFWIAGMFPDKVNWIIAIDTLKPPQIPREKYWSEMGSMITRSMLIDERCSANKEPPSYSYEECVERLSAGSSIDKDKCHYLLQRNLKESKMHPNQYYFRRDGRLKFMNKGIWPQDYYVALASRIRMPHLYINAQDDPYNEPMENINETLSILRKNPLFEFAELPGRHHVHLNNPKNVARIIRNFIKKHSNTLIKPKLKYPEKYYFTRDARLKYANDGVWPRAMYMKLMGRIKCPTLMIRALESSLSNMEDFNRDLAVMRRNPQFEYYETDGSHHVHLNEPNKLSSCISQFLLKHIPTEKLGTSKL